MFGKAIETEFTGVKSRRRGKNKTTTYIITSKVVTDGITRQFKSEELRRDPTLYTDIPNRITVVIDPNNPSQYALDISFSPNDVFKPVIRVRSGNCRLNV